MCMDVTKVSFLNLVKGKFSKLGEFVDGIGSKAGSKSSTDNKKEDDKKEEEEEKKEDNDITLDIWE